MFLNAQIVQMHSSCWIFMAAFDIQNTVHTYDLTHVPCYLAYIAIFSTAHVQFNVFNRFFCASAVAHRVAPN